MTFVRVARVEDVSGGLGQVFATDGFRILLVRLEGEVFALQPTCPHRGCDWDGAKLDGEVLSCPKCQFRYSARTGLNPLTTACHVNQSTAAYHYRHFPEGHAQLFDVRIVGEELTVATTPRPFCKVIV
jgi:nitrite reductase (NADH) small subunit